MRQYSRLTHGPAHRTISRAVAGVGAVGHSSRPRDGRRRRAMRTFMATTTGAASASTWYLVDAKGQVLGRLASRIALVLRGKAKPTFTPSVAGDHVIVVNADKIPLTGKKAQKKIYYRHSANTSGIRAPPAG